MKYEAKRSRFEGEWVVEAINMDGDGEIYVTVFAGPESKKRASEYASWKNNQDRNEVTA